MKGDQVEINIYADDQIAIELAKNPIHRQTFYTHKSQDCRYVYKTKRLNKMEEI